MSIEDSMKDTFRDLMRRMNHQTEDFLKEELSEMIERGILHFYQTRPTYVTDENGKLRLEGKGKLVCDNWGYIQKLESKIENLENILKSIKEIVLSETPK